MRNRESRKGIAIVEFALLMSLLLVPLVAGVWDISRFIDISQVLTRAAREGVVLASRGQDPTSAVTEHVTAGGLDAANLTVTVNHSASQPGLGQEVTVHLSYDFTDDTLFPWEDFMPGGINRAAYAKME